MTSPLARAPDATVLDLPGLEADNLLAFLALLGLLRALEIAKPNGVRECRGRGRRGKCACILLRRSMRAEWYKP
jgi:hypothetical protein